MLNTNNTSSPVPSYDCVKGANILKPAFVKEIDQTAFLVGDQSARDQYMGGRGLGNLQGLSSWTVAQLKSGAGRVKIGTIAELASYRGNFRGTGIRQQQISLLESYRAALNACKVPEPVNTRKVTATCNDPTMRATMTPGREILRGNGQPGYAEVELRGKPSNNGVVESELTIGFGPMTIRGIDRPINLGAFEVSVLAADSTMQTAYRMKEALVAKGLQCDVTPAFGPPQQPVKLQIWSPLLTD